MREGGERDERLLRSTEVDNQFENGFKGVGNVDSDGLQLNQNTLLSRLPFIS